jgi:hypothetical protein
MSEDLAVWILAALGAYALLGLAFAIPFLLGRIDRVDAAARGAGWGFRLLVLPGVLVLWPLLLSKRPIAEAEDAP